MATALFVLNLFEEPNTITNNDIGLQVEFDGSCLDQTFRIFIPPSTGITVPVKKSIAGKQTFNVI